MRKINKFLLFGAVLLSSGFAFGGEGKSFADQLEMLEWSDPERAVQIVDAAPPLPADSTASEIEMLEIRAMVYANSSRDEDVNAIERRLDVIASAGDASALRAGRFVRAYSARRHGQYAAAEAELKGIDINSVDSDSERYRIVTLRGLVLRILGQDEAALPYLELALDLANKMHDDLRIVHSMLSLARIYTDSGNFDRAMVQLAAARRLATRLGDETSLVETEERTADIADRRGDRVEERRASLAGLDHAKRSGSSKWLELALVNLGDSYLKTRDFAESLKYSKQALPIMQRTNQRDDEQITLFNEGLAYIGLGSIKAGEKLAEGSITEALAGSDLLDAKELLREYADALEHAGYLMMAIQAYHRYDAISEKFMTNTRQRAFLELSAQFDDERKARELELLRRDNALKVSEMRGQRLLQQLIIAGALFIAVICAALVWAFARVSKANDRLRFSSEHDPLTGLSNRRYFNECVLAVDGGRPVGGCVLLADLDHFKRINDTYGHPAGDAVLAAMSQRLTAALRENDKLVRWGGEEFLAMLGPMTPAQADLTAERLLQAVRRDPVLWNGHLIRCTISIGYACFPMAGSATDISLDSAISLVDKALYEAKRRGRDRACLIKVVRARDEKDLTTISSEFESATTDRRVQLVEILGAAA
ncbi:MAG TPA: tetratricopeptide repeat-containing diguanylate cyclase [Steroidobacteraceae bacterium]|jgi:diguanylate cyclase (GGDEF)-like protein|nr:tetratricopeptide repeat-containing diguanylate cyclase [Steroidobacteraceae bacterium]